MVTVTGWLGRCSYLLESYCLSFLLEYNIYNCNYLLYQPSKTWPCLAVSVGYSCRRAGSGQLSRYSSHIYLSGRTAFIHWQIPPFVEAGSIYKRGYPKRFFISVSVPWFTRNSASRSTDGAQHFRHLSLAWLVLTTLLKRPSIDTNRKSNANRQLPPQFLYTYHSKSNNITIACWIDSPSSNTLFK